MSQSTRLTYIKYKKIYTINYLILESKLDTKYNDCEDDDNYINRRL